MLYVNLNIQRFASGTIPLSIYTGSYNVTFQGKLEWYSNSNGSAANSSELTVNLYARKQNSSSATTGKSWSGSIIATDTTTGASYGANIDQSVSRSIKNDWVLLATLTATIPHNADGTKSIELYGSVTGPSGTSLSSATSNGSAVVSLDTIPRKTSIGNHSGTIGSAMNISFSPASSTFLHTLKYSFGSTSERIVTQVSSTSFSWTPPTDLYAQIPNGTYGTGTFTLYTYDANGNLIGESSSVLTLYANQSNCTPVATGTNSLVDINSTTKALTGNENILVKGYSTGKVTFNAQIKNYASIRSLTLNGNSINYSSSVSGGTTTISASVQINNISSQSVTLVLTDSRGYSLTKTISASDLKNYVTLTINADFKRVTPTGGHVKLVANGNYYNGSFGSVANTLTLSWAVRLKGSGSYTTGSTSITPTISGNSYSINVEITNPLQDDGLFDYLKEYDFIIYYKDKLIDTNVTDNITKGQGDLEIYNGAILMAGTVLFYDDEKFTQNSDGSFSKV